MILEYIVKDNKYQNINQILKLEFHLSARLLHKLIIEKHIFLNGNNVDTRNSVKIDDIITINLDFEEESENIIATPMKLNIIFEDDGLLILNKPAGIAVHPSVLHYENSLSNGVKFYFDSIGLKRKIRPVTRLDLNTSGLIIFAKNEYIQESLIQQMISGVFKKEYIAIVSGHFNEQSGTINLPIARKKESIIERCIDYNGQESITDYHVLKQNDDFAIVKCLLKTGRTHQIRVHMASIGHPLLGDTLYGISCDWINRQALHSYKICFIHPISHKNMSFICELPDDMKIDRSLFLEKGDGLFLSKPISRVLSFKIVIYLGHISLYISSHTI